MRTALEGIAIHIVGTQFSCIAITANLIFSIIPKRTIGYNRNDFVLLPCGGNGKRGGLIQNRLGSIELVLYRVFG